MHLFRRLQSALASTLVNVYLGGWAQAAQPDLQALFPQAQPPITPAPAVSVSQAGSTMTLTSVRFSPKSGVTHWVAAKWCGLEIVSRGKPVQVITVIGTSHFEALSCDRLKAAGSIPPAGAAARIGLIYATRSPNFASVTPVVLARTAQGQWAIDETVNEALDALQEEPTIASVQRALAKR